MSRVATRVGIASHGVWRLRHDIATLVDATPVRLSKRWPSHVDAVAGWGFKPTAAYARDFARRRGLPYIALEDGFLRSVEPGRAPSLSYVVDRTGIYYDAHQPSDLESLLQGAEQLPTEDLARGAAAAHLLRSRALSKYNTTRNGKPHPPIGILVVDQTADDASIVGALADADAFRIMLEAAIGRVGRDAVFVKLHPETISGRKAGHLRRLARDSGVRVVEPDSASWSVIAASKEVFTVSSQLGFEALLADIPVTCFGMPFYAGWGLTTDRLVCPRRTARPTLAALAATVLLRYAHYLDPWNRQPIAFEEAVHALAFLRDRYHENASRSVLVGLSKPKIARLAPLLTGPSGPPRSARDVPSALAMAVPGERLVVWGARVPGLADTTKQRGLGLLRAEDGFVRSAGLGSAFVPSCSFVLDDLGLHYDPTHPSRFETLAESFASTPELAARAAALRAHILAERITKYGPLGRPAQLPASARRKVLVVGQVEDDASVRLGASGAGGNLGLLRRARTRHPEALLVYRPHPDVVRGYRRGRLSADAMRQHADIVAAWHPIADLLAWCDHVETLTSLTGFEALLRGKSVTVHGRPFYGGWGLTEDLVPFERRTRTLSVDELVAVALILYPRYVDPVSGLVCPPEILMDRLAAQQRLSERLPDALKNRVWEVGRHWQARFRHAVIGPISRVMRRLH